MSNSTNTGAAILGLAQLSKANRETDNVVRAHNEVVDQYADYIFRAKSHVHGLRAVDRAHVCTEELLIAALKAENPNHPLASKEAVEAVFENERVKAILNPEVIKRTYPDGRLPNDAVSGDPPVVYNIA